MTSPKETTDAAQEILDMLKRRKAQLERFRAEYAGDPTSDDYIATCLLSIELSALILMSEAILNPSRTPGATLQ